MLHISWPFSPVHLSLISHRSALSSLWQTVRSPVCSHIPLSLQSFCMPVYANELMETHTHTKKSSCKSAFSTMDGSVNAVSLWVSLAHFSTKDSARHSLHVCLFITRLLSCSSLGGWDISKRKMKTTLSPIQTTAPRLLSKRLYWSAMHQPVLNIHRLDNSKTKCLASSSLCVRNA